MNRDVEEIITEAERQGWRLARRTNHVKLLAPNGRDFVFMASTPGGGRAIQNTVASLRRRGFKWKGR